jgi:hypothetical protein
MPGIGIVGVLEYGRRYLPGSKAAQETTIGGSCQSNRTRQ